MVLEVAARASQGDRIRALLRVVALCIPLGAGVTACAQFSACGLRECSADAHISANVRTLLASRPELGGSNSISVQTMHGVVYLSGLVSTPYQVAEAGGIAEQAPGVTGIQNRLAIDNSR